MLNNNQSNSDTIQYSPREKHIRSSGTCGDFSQREIHLSISPFFFIPGLEKVFSALYFISVPHNSRSFF